MTTGADIFSTLGPMFEGRVYPLVGPFDVARPVCIYQLVGGQSVSTFCGESDGKNNHFQIWVWTPTALQTYSMMDTVSGLLTGPPLRGVPQGRATDAGDNPERVHGLVRTFSFWS